MRPYPLLRHHEDSPQLPTGYPGMVLMALLPPLWFHVMNPRVERLRQCEEPGSTPGIAAQEA